MWPKPIVKSLCRRPARSTLIAAGVMALALVTLVPTAQAQFFPFFSSQPRKPILIPRQQPQQQPPQSSFPFSPFGGGSFSAPPAAEPRADYSRAPAPRKPDTPPTTKVVVMGDSMADWLAYGLEDALSETPEIGVVRKHRTYSGLLRYDSKADSNWAQVAREVIAAEKPDVVVMMVGINDRQAMRDRQPTPAAKKGPAAPGAPADQPTADPAKDEQQAANQKPDPNADSNQNPDDQPDTPLIAPEPPTRSGSGPLFEFRTDRWNTAYGKRIDETIAALKSANVPVIWVGLPALRGTRSTADMLYLDGLYRAAADKASITYTDVWDGFVDEGGKFALQGPDFEGQIRRLRAADGVHFTKAGAVKLAHYVERDIRRLMANRMVPVALPAPDVTAPTQQQAAKPGGPAARPLVGPVLPLSTVSDGSDELLGAASTRSVQLDAVATAVLIRGDATTPPQGRADDFRWPRADLPPVDPASGPTVPSPPPVASAKDATPAAAVAGVRRPNATPQTSANAGAPQRRAPGFEQRAASDRPSRPPGPPASDGGFFFGLFR